MGFSSATSFAPFPPAGFVKRFQQIKLAQFSPTAADVDVLRRSDHGSTRQFRLAPLNGATSSHFLPPPTAATVVTAKHACGALRREATTGFHLHEGNSRMSLAA